MSETPPSSASAQGNVERNLLTWDRQYDWPEDGDEWKGQAELCGVSYSEWKDSLVRHLIVPYAGNVRMIEIAPGHGRWTEHFVAHAAHVTVVDLSTACIEFCRQRFADRNNIDYFVTPSNTLPPDATGQIDLVWSYDSFVHMHPDIVRGYLREIHRVLRPGGLAIIHHANVENPATHAQDGSPGWRSPMNAGMMRAMAEDAGLTVEAQFVYWDEARKIGVPRFGDRIARLRRPAAAD